MKQHITKKQGKEISKSQQKVILDWFLEKNLGLSYLNVKIGDKSFFNIGKMIEFLGNDLDSIENMRGSYIVYNKEQKQIEEKELCDALWQLIKYKLQK